jgi:DNA-binding NarL/FixJ family response regulator
VPDTNGEGGVMGVSPPVWVVSPHLLVAQTVAAALQSVGTAAEAHPWEWVVRNPDDADFRTPRHLVVILDGLDSAEIVEQVRRLVGSGRARVLVVTSGEFAVWWGGLLEDDAIDIVTMTTSVVLLARAVERFVAGGSSMDAEGRRALRASWSEAVASRRRLESRLDTLSPQQRRVLELLASGHRVSEVGEVLGVSRGTVRSHVKSVRAKLGARTQL